MIYIDKLDHDVWEPKKLRGEALDKHVLSHSKRISVFWATETQARAVRLYKWQKQGRLVLRRSTFPWHVVERFDTEAGQ